MSPVPSFAAHRHPAPSSSTRGHNLALALRCVAANSGAVSRAGIAASTGLTRSTASSLVDGLIAGGLVREVGSTAHAGVGRPATALALRPDGAAGLGLDIQVDYVAACVVDLTGAIRYQHIVAQDQRGRSVQEVLDRTVMLANRITAAAQDAGLRLCGTAASVPGIVNLIQGTVAMSPILGWQDVPVVKILEQAFGHRVGLDNDTNFAALSEEKLLRAGRSYLYVSAQVGVGAGVVIEGELYRGRHGWSGEIGHQTIDPDGPLCGCGKQGCLEQYVGHEAILRAVGVSGAASTTFTGDATAAQVRRRADEGDPTALAVLTTVGAKLGQVIADCLNLLDVDHVVLGGIYRELAPWLQPGIESLVGARFVGARWSPPTVAEAAYGDEAPALGAARSVIRDVINDPLHWLAG